MACLVVVMFCARRVLCFYLVKRGTIINRMGYLGTAVAHRALAVIVEPSHTWMQAAGAFCVARLKAKLTLDKTCNKSSLLLVHKLVYVVCPSGAICAQVVHAIIDRTKSLSPFIELA